MKIVAIFPILVPKLSFYGNYNIKLITKFQCFEKCFAKDKHFT